MRGRRRQTWSIAGSMSSDVLVAPAANEELSADPARRNSPRASRSYGQCTAPLPLRAWLVRVPPRRRGHVRATFSPPACLMCCWSTPAGPAVASVWAERWWHPSLSRPRYCHLKYILSDSVGPRSDPASLLCWWVAVSNTRLLLFCFCLFFFFKKCSFKTSKKVLFPTSISGLILI